MASSTDPIGIFDSGLGGLTVMKEIAALLPEEELIYFGDTARVPYGNKSAETVRRYAHEIADSLLAQNIKLLVVACNTASAHALPSLAEVLPIPVIGVIEPGVKAAAKATEAQKVAVLATRSTIQSNAYETSLCIKNPHLEVTSIPCPLFVPLVEENYFDSPAAEWIVQETLAPAINNGCDTLLLGCTHYPLMKHIIEKAVPGACIIDSATTCAADVQNTLASLSLLNKKRSSENHFYVSDDPVRFEQMGSLFYGSPIAAKKEPQPM